MCDTSRYFYLDTFILSLGEVAESGVEQVGCRASSSVSFVFSGVLNPGYIFVNIGVDADIPTHEVSDLDPLELIFADDSSDSYFLSEMVQREGQREMVRYFSSKEPSSPQLGRALPRGSMLGHDQSAELEDRKL